MLSIGFMNSLIKVMKKILFFVLTVLLFTGCCSHTIGNGNEFVVTAVEKGGTRYKYVVTFKTTCSENWDYYQIFTNENYRVGDTLVLSLK